MPVKSDQKSTRVMIPVDLSDDSEEYFIKQVSDIIKVSPKLVELDCSQLKWVTSRHVNLIWRSYSISREAGIKIKLTNTTERLIRVLKVLDIYDLLPSEAAETTQTISIDSIPKNIPLDDSWEISFLPSIEEITLVQERFRNFLESLKVSDLFKFEIETVYYEIATNIRNHSAIETGEKVFLQCWPLKDKLAVEIRYQGNEFDSTNVPDVSTARVSAQKGYKRGYGLMMINRMTDNMTYTRDHNGTNILKLEKYWR
jgi:anti-sigma regulatory factor (Ser/Thr protein kinase)